MKNNEQPFFDKANVPGSGGLTPADIALARMAARREKPISDLLPFSSLITDDVVLCKDGSLITTFSIEGVPFETSSTRVLQQAARHINRFLVSIARNDVAVQVHRVRRHFRDALTPVPGTGFAADFSRKYNEMVGKRSLMATEIYVTVIQGEKKEKQQTGALAKLFGLGQTSSEEMKARLAKRLFDFEQLADQFQSALAQYRCARLGTIRGSGADGMADYSPLLSFYNYLVTGEWQDVRVPSGPLDMALGNVQVFFKRDMLQLQTSSGSRFVQSIEFKDYPENTSAGMLDSLLYRDGTYARTYEFIEAQTFALMSKTDGRYALELQRKQLVASGDKAANQILMLNYAQQGLIGGEFAMGEYSYSLLVFGDTEAECRENTNDACEKLKKCGDGFLPYISTMTAPAAYLSVMPTHLRYRPRPAKITSANFAALAPFHNFLPGKRDFNPWGQALALLPQPSDQPYYLNLHHSPRFENSYGKPYAGNTVVLGSTGVGKTAFISFMATMAMKYREPGKKFTMIFFDKDHGAEILVRALKGTYLAVENGQPTGFNPFALDNTDENRQFLIRFIHLMLKQDGRPISAADEEKISQAVSSVMRMEKPMRRLSTFMQNLTEGVSAEEQANSIPRRLSQWYGNGAYAWVFDNWEDVIDFDERAVCGIDGTDFLDHPVVKTLIAYYLLYRVNQVLDGRRLIFIMDEFWKWLDNDAFRGFARDQLKTIRKKNALILLATQSPSDVLKSEISRAVVEQTSTQIFLPNPRADEDEYLNGFKVTPEEFYIIRELRETSRAMLIKQNTGSALVKCDLSAFPDELNVLSSTTENIEIMHALIEVAALQLGREAAEDPDVWLPAFYEAVRENRRAHTGQALGTDSAESTESAAETTVSPAESDSDSGMSQSDTGRRSSKPTGGAAGSLPGGRGR